MKTDSTFEGLVYYTESLDRFSVLDYRRKPKSGDWVVTSRDGPEDLTIDRYRGQPYIAVVVWLGFYLLQHSEQYTPPPVEDAA